MTLKLINYARKFSFSLINYAHIVGLHGIAKAAIGRIKGKPEMVNMIKPDIKFPFYLRVPSSDVRTYRQVFLDKEYGFDVKYQPKTEKQ